MIAFARAHLLVASALSALVMSLAMSLTPLFVAEAEFLRTLMSALAAVTALLVVAPFVMRQADVEILSPRRLGFYYITSALLVIGVNYAGTIALRLTFDVPVYPALQQVLWLSAAALAGLTVFGVRGAWMGVAAILAMINVFAGTGRHLPTEVIDLIVGVPAAVTVVACAMAVTIARTAH